jgi:hypothetical protein
VLFCEIKGMRLGRDEIVVCRLSSGEVAIERHLARKFEALPMPLATVDRKLHIKCLLQEI